MGRLLWSGKIALLLAAQVVAAWFALLGDPLPGLLVFTTALPFVLGLAAGRYLRLGLLSTLAPLLPIPLVVIVLTLRHGEDMLPPISFDPTGPVHAPIHASGGPQAWVEFLGLLWMLGWGSAGWGVSLLAAKWFDPPESPAPGLF